MTDKLKNRQTMTTGVSLATINTTKPIDLHGKSLKVIASTVTDTIVQYPNGAQRQFATPDLAAYLDLGTFPHGTAFYRETDKGTESLFIEFVNPAAYIVEMVDADGNSSSESMSYADLAAWHETGHKLDPNISLPAGQLYVPKTVPAEAAGAVKTFAAAIDDSAEPDDQPFETDLQKEVENLRAKLEQAHKDAEQAEINGQIRINALVREVGKLNADLVTQHDLHVTQLLAKNELIERLEAKAAIVTSACKQYAIKYDLNESDLNKLASEGWQLQHTQFVKGDLTFNQLNAVLVRDLPASTPAPKVAATDAAIYSTPVTPAPRPPVQQPPLPTGQTIISTATPVTGRMLTNNGPKPGETKRIPTLADIQARRQQHEVEMQNIFDQTAANLEMRRREAANRPSPFPVTGVQPS